LEALNVLAEPRKDIDVFRSYPPTTSSSLFVFVFVCTAPVDRRYSFVAILLPVHFITKVWGTKRLTNCRITAICNWELWTTC